MTAADLFAQFLLVALALLGSAVGWLYAMLRAHARLIETMRAYLARNGPWN